MRLPEPRHRFRADSTSAAFALLLAVSFALPTLAGAQIVEIGALSAPGSVTYDVDGVPHICGRNDRDTMLLHGWVHARDRFFQMDVLRRQFSGTLAELVGEAAIPSDVQFRTFGLRRAAERTLAAYQGRGLVATVDILEAYAEGVNAYLMANPLPVEYAALELTAAEPWTVLDSLTVAKGLAFGLSFNLLELDLTVLAGNYQGVGAVAGFDGMALLFEDVVRTAPFDPTISIPQPGPSGRAAPSHPAYPAPKTETVAMAREVVERLRGIPALAGVVEPPAGETGSNWWLVSPGQSATGHAMLANDPHLALDSPSTFYESHLVSSETPGCGLGGDGAQPALAFSTGLGDGSGDASTKTAANMTGLDVIGTSFAGVPGVVLGCNDSACWGATVNPLDVADVYQETLIVDPALGLPTHTQFRGELEALIPIPQQFRANRVGDGTPGNLEIVPIGPTEGGVTLVVPRRNNGPIIETIQNGGTLNGLSVQYTGWGPTLELEAFLRFGRARSVDAFRDALQFFDVGSQNFAYADTAGNIAYFTSAEMPLREDLQTLNAPDGGIPPFLIRDGTGALRHEWLPRGTSPTAPSEQSLPYEILPFDEMPQLVNPPVGYIINANNDPVGTSLDNNPLNQVRPGGGLYYLSPGYVSLRVGRIRRDLESRLAKGPLSRDDLEAMQANNQLLDAELVRPYLLTAYANANDGNAPPALIALATDPRIAEAIARLAAWDFSTPTGLDDGYDPFDDPDALAPATDAEIQASIAATIWSAFRGQAVRKVVDGTLARIGLGDFTPDSRSAYKALAHRLAAFETDQGVGASGVPFFPASDGMTAAQARDLALLDSLRQALDALAGDAFASAFGGSGAQDDYRWGRLHRIVFDHPLGGPFNVPPGGGVAELDPGLAGVARAGGYEAVDASSHSARADGAEDFRFGSGPARRFIGILDPDGPELHEIVPGAQRPGDPGAPSQLGRWLTNRYHPLRRDAGDLEGAVIEQVDFEVPPPCVPGSERLCLIDGMFAVTGTWQLPGLGGTAQTVPGSSALSGNLWFFRAPNWEVLVKTLDGCQTNGHYWVFLAGATNVAWQVTVTHTATGESKVYSHPMGPPSPATIDTRAFPCP